MHRAGFAEEAAAKDLEDPVGLQQDAPEALGILGIKGAMRGVCIEADRRGDFIGPAVDAHGQFEPLQLGHQTRVERGHRLRHQRHARAAAVAAAHQQRLIDEIEFDLEAAAAMGHGRGGQTTGREVQRHVPAVVEPGALRQPDLAHDLRPQVQRGIGLGPSLEWQCGPWLQSLRSVHEHDPFHQAFTKSSGTAVRPCTAFRTACPAPGGAP